MEITFKDILRIIKKNLVFIIVVSVLSGLISLFITMMFVPKTYTTSVKLYVNIDRVGKTSMEDLQNVNYAQKMVATYIQLLDTNSFYTSVAENLNNDYSAAKLKNMVSFTEVEDTEVFKATVNYTSPTEVKRIANAVADVAPVTIQELLSNNAQLKIVDEAQTPNAPSSPNVSRNVIIAFAAALVLTLLISFLRDYFDVKIKYDEDMTVICGMPVLAAVPEFKTQEKTKANKS